MGDKQTLYSSCLRPYSMGMTNRQCLDTATCYYSTTNGDASMARMLSNHAVDAWPQRRLQAIADLHLMGEAVAAAETLSR